MSQLRTSFSETLFRFSTSDTKNWSIHGLQPGQNFKSIRKKLPIGTKIDKIGDDKYLSISDRQGHQVVLSLSDTGIILTVAVFPVQTGFSLEKDGDSWISGSFNRAEIAALFGRKGLDDTFSVMNQDQKLSLTFDSKTSKLQIVSLSRAVKSKSVVKPILQNATGPAIKAR